VSAETTQARPAPGPVIGLRREREVLTVALQTHRHVVLEGPPGTGKSTLLRAIAADVGLDVVFVEGNAELTPARLVGQYDPAAVLADGYVPASFTDGPLLTAMRGSGLLYLEELNRIPEETLNVLITVLTEGEITVPRLGLVRATSGFRLIAAMNPFDAVGTARVGQAIADRMCRVVLGYQDAAAERAIVAAVTAADPSPIGLAVRLVRATREHRDLRMGSSVRGAIDLVLLLDGLLRLRGGYGLSAPGARETARDAAQAALSGRVRVAEGVDRTSESVIDSILDDVWPENMPPPEDGPEDTGPAGDGQGKDQGLPAEAAGPDSASSLRRHRRGGGGRRQTSRRELSARHEAFEQVSPAVGELDEDAFGALLAKRPDAAAALLADLALATDRDLRAAARRLAARVLVRAARMGPTRTRGTRRLVADRRTEGDLDLDRTLDRWSGRWPPDTDELVVRRWTGSRRAVCLLVDCSGSMTGLAVAIAAVAAAGVVLAAADLRRPGRGAQPAGRAAGRRGPGRPAGRAARARDDRPGRGAAGGARPARGGRRGRAAGRAAVGLPAHDRRPARVGAGGHRPAARALPAADRRVVGRGPGAGRPGQGDGRAGARRDGRGPRADPPPELIQPLPRRARNGQASG
jgi:MoxR-like ATPase